MRARLFYTLAVSMLIICSCSQTSTKETPQEIIKKYERFVLQMRADSISQLFTVDAEVGHENQPVIKGRDSIYAFLSSFKNAHVINNSDEIVSSSIKDNSAIVDGNYKQTVIVSGKDTVNVSGKFTATMTRDKNKNWLISKMKTRSN